MSPQKIPDTNGLSAVLVLEQFAHLDWDWLNCFPTNVDGSNPIDTDYFSGLRQPANTIYAEAYGLIQGSPDYAYATCEIGFLRAFGQAQPAMLANMVKSGQLRIIGGGITSPDNLLSNGETFFRNYLVGLQWMQSVSLPWTRCIWLPDDFGHDSQLPVQLAAMDVLAVGFARCPQATAYQGNMTRTQPSDAGIQLAKSPEEGGGCDFWWQAADKSLVFAHWMPSSYAQGETLYNKDGVPGFDPMAVLQGYLADNQTCSPTALVHVPVASDFWIPLGGGQSGNLLLSYIEQWTTQNPSTPAVLSTFDQYVNAVLAQVRRSGGGSLETRTFHGASPETTFRSNPNWMGFYASRMNIKRLHQQATRVLLAAETLDAVLAALGTAAPDTTALLALWNDLVPSTHHDYITGTAVDQVVSREQMVLLGEVDRGGAALMAAWLTALAATINPPAPSLVVFNPLGLSRPGGLVKIPSSLAQQLRLPVNQSQNAADGEVLVYVSAPSAGYRTFTGSTTLFPTAPQAAKCAASDDGRTYTLWNGLISATISAAEKWELTAVASGSGEPFVRSGNRFSFFADAGSIYEFGFECAGPQWSCSQDENTFRRLSPTIVPGPATQTENGPLRVAVQATIDVTVTAGQTKETQTYTLEYSLAAGEPFLRMRVIGQAPSGTSMFTSFTFTEAIDSMEHGTPYHWDTKMPAQFGTSADWSSVFEPTHDFVSVSGTNDVLGAIYHRSVPAWAINGTDLAGAILRNTPSPCDCDGRGAEGSDDGPHIIEYALRVPDGLGAASSGQPLQESRAYNTPLYATLATPSSGTAPLDFSLAHVIAPGPAMITALKRGTFNARELFLRVYQPSNDQSTIISVATAWNTTGAVAVTALEQTPFNPGPDIVTVPNEFSFTPPHAITTIRLPPRS